MRDHSECEREMAKARTEGRYGYLEWLATRCDRTHGRLAATEPAPAQPESSETEESQP